MREQPENLPQGTRNGGKTNIPEDSASRLDQLSGAGHRLIEFNGWSGDLLFRECQHSKHHRSYLNTSHIRLTE